MKNPQFGGASEQITRQGGFAPVFGDGGRSLHYTESNSDISSLWKLDSATGTRTLVEPAVIKRTYAPTKDGVYFFTRSQTGDRNSLCFINAATGRKTVVSSTTKRLGNGVGLSPDGAALYFTQLDQGGEELLLAPGFWR